MLQAANFVCVESKRFNFFKGRLLTSYLEKLAAKCLPALCSSYLLVVKKQIITLTPLPVTGWTSPFWSKKPVVPVALQRKDHG